MFADLMKIRLIPLLFSIWWCQAQKIAFPKASPVILGRAVCYKVHSLLLQSDDDMLDAVPSGCDRFACQRRLPSCRHEVQSNVPSASRKSLYGPTHPMQACAAPPPPPPPPPPPLFLSAPPPPREAGGGPPPPPPLHVPACVAAAHLHSPGPRQPIPAVDMSKLCNIKQAICCAVLWKRSILSIMHFLQPGYVEAAVVSYNRR